MVIEWNEITLVLFSTAYCKVNDNVLPNIVALRTCTTVFYRTHVYPMSQFKPYFYFRFRWLPTASSVLLNFSIYGIFSQHVKILMTRTWRVPKWVSSYLYNWMLISSFCIRNTECVFDHISDWHAKFGESCNKLQTLLFSSTLIKTRDVKREPENR